ncbi:hypothetical protein ACHAXS_000350 [Conticribra weissflogii]
MKPINPRHGAPFCLNDYMQKCCFLDICAATTFTNKQPPAFNDPFYDVRQMLKTFNKHYKHHYISSWLNCLDENMSLWLNQYCPDFINHILVAINTIELLMATKESHGYCVAAGILAHSMTLEFLGSHLSKREGNIGLSMFLARRLKIT